MSVPTIYALFVGINEYKYLPKNPLTCCVNDIERVNEYLKKNKTDLYDYVPSFLRNAEATREAILAAFQTKLIDQAEEGDIAIFYFSGHGGQEKAPSYFADYERDGLLEGIVCHDSGKGGEYKISDKELRYLLYILSQKNCEIISLFDSCHSGDNVRVELEEDYVARQDLNTSEARGIDDFIFSKDPAIKQALLKGNASLDEILPQGRFVQMAACEDKEFAYENKKFKNGMFTHYLLKNLEARHGIVSYHDLAQKISLDMSANPHASQHPQVYTPKGSRDLIFKRFLFGKIDKQPISSTLYYDFNEHRWLVNLGAFHGLSMEPEEIEGFDQEIWADIGPDNLRKVRLEAVFTTYSEISFSSEDSLKLNTSKQYTAFFPGAMQHPLYIQVTPVGDKDGIEDLKSTYLQHKEELNPKGLFLLEENEDPANLSKEIYQVNVDKDYFTFSLAGVGQNLIPPISRKGIHRAKELFEQLSLISKWNFVKQLENPRTTDLDQGVELSVKLSSLEEALVHSGKEHLTLHHKPKSSGEKISVSFTFKNLTKQSVHFACIYLDSEFGVQTDFLENSPVELAAKGEDSSIRIPERGRISLQLSPFLFAENYEKETVYFKVILSAKPFDSDIFYSPAIKPEQVKRKGFVVEKDIEEWTTQTFGFDLINPDYKA